MNEVRVLQNSKLQYQSNNLNDSNIALPARSNKGIEPVSVHSLPSFSLVSTERKQKSIVDSSNATETQHLIKTNTEKLYSRPNLAKLKEPVLYDSRGITKRFMVQKEAQTPIKDIESYKDSSQKLKSQSKQSISQTKLSLPNFEVFHVDDLRLKEIEDDLHEILRVIDSKIQKVSQENGLEKIEMLKQEKLNLLNIKRNLNVYKNLRRSLGLKFGTFSDSQFVTRIPFTDFSELTILQAHTLSSYLKVNLLA
jgi:hypothetical protein